ncbi:unnamed protein product [Notodromas monacha]|uniref:Kinesin motor domain-containing protein n=1 Tax=Notodromas monacha TaxID=399045 RepID=A0A7R9BZM7_9CRUS|nr:unnamed protein product [Notodromas monacha]CAG0923508.1 unnamed protein product [Notodromas monacha]
MYFGQVMDLLAKGNERRAVGATAMNAASSRSHAIFNLTVEQHPIGTPTAHGMCTQRVDECRDAAGRECSLPCVPRRLPS